MPGRQFTAGIGYRYGFNGKELDAEGNLVQYDYGFRIYDPRIGRFKSIDPLMRHYPMLTPYQFASNTPIQAIDLDGLEATYYDKSGKVVCSGPCNPNDAYKNGWFRKDQSGTLLSVQSPNTNSFVTAHNLPPTTSTTSKSSTTSNVLKGAWNSFRSLWVRDKPLGAHGSDASEDPGVIEGVEQLDNTIRNGSQEEKEQLAGSILFGIIVSKVGVKPNGGNIFSAPKIFRNAKNQLTNGKYILDETGMAPHTTGDLSTGKSQFLFNVDANKAVLDAAAYADKHNLWNPANNAAKVPVVNGNVGVLGKTGEQTNYINVYRTNTGFVHGSPGNPPKTP